MLAVAKSHHFITNIGPRPAIELASRLPAAAWHRLSAGTGAKGQRWYDWALVEVTGQDWLLVCRRIHHGQYAFHRAHASTPVPLADLLAVAGTRWQIEESFAGAKELTGLDELQFPPECGGISYKG